MSSQSVHMNVASCNHDNFANDRCFVYPDIEREDFEAMQCSAWEVLSIILLTILRTFPYCFSIGQRI